MKLSLNNVCDERRIVLTQAERIKPPDEVLRSAMELWGLVEYPQLIRMVENFVYKTADQSGAKILRLTEPHQRTIDEVEAELDWISFLNEEVDGVTVAVQSKEEKLAHFIRCDDLSFSAVVFEFAAGNPVKEPFGQPDSFFRSWGELLGKMHRATKDYEVPSHISRRSNWQKDRGLVEARKWANRTGESQKLQEMEAWLGSLPVDIDVFGLVHRDAHFGNMHLDSQTITIFDFDDSCYHWFSYDIAVCLVLLKYDSTVKNLDKEYARSKKNFLNGYLSANHLDEKWIGRIDAMQYIHLLVLYYWCYGHTVDRRIGEGGVEWCQKYVDWFSTNEGSLYEGFDQI